MSGRFEISKRKRYAALILGLFVFLVYAIFPMKTFYWDGVIYAQLIESASGFEAGLFHPNHLIYNFLGYSVYQSAKVFNESVRALYVLQFITIVFGGLCASVFFLITERLLKSSYLVFSMTAIFAFSAGWWRYAADADVYIISIFFLLICFLTILPERSPRPFLVALVHTAAMLFHELAVLFFPAAVLGIYFQTAAMEKRERLNFTARYAVTVFLLIFPIYYLSFYLQKGNLDLGNFIDWIISFAPSAGVRRSFADIINHSFVRHYKIFIDGSTNLFQRGILNFVLFAVFAGSALLFVIKTARNLGEFKNFWKNALKKENYSQPIIILCAAWIIPYLIFLSFFSPENLFYRLFYFPALIILIGTVFFSGSEKLKPHRGRLAFFAVAFCLYNFLFYIQPNSVVREGTQIATALEAKNIWSDKTVVLYDATVSDEANTANNRLVGYFNSSVAWKPLDFITLRDFENKISELKNSGNSIWLDVSATRKLSSDAQSAKWLSENSIERAALTAPKYNMKFIEIVPKLQR